MPLLSQVVIKLYNINFNKYNDFYEPLSLKRFRLELSNNKGSSKRSRITLYCM